jgi:hypothetical protein|eukprot:SAG25_NODE_337_length_9543_cov_4.171961_8_plen_100_part_00
MSRAEQQRDEQLGEMSSVRSTVREQMEKRQGRQRRQVDHSLAAAGDLDEVGERRLHEELRSTAAAQQSAQEVNSYADERHTRARACVGLACGRPLLSVC